MRKTAMQVLLLWLFSTSAFAFEQCCEAVAEAIPHHSEHNQANTKNSNHHSVTSDTHHADNHHSVTSDAHHADNHHSVSSDAHHEEGYEHCPTSSADISDIPLVLSHSNQWDEDSVTLQSYTEVVYQHNFNNLFRPDNSKWIVNRRSTYLDTRRLRI